MCALLPKEEEALIFERKVLNENKAEEGKNFCQSATKPIYFRKSCILVAIKLGPGWCHDIENKYRC